MIPDKQKFYVFWPCKCAAMGEKCEFRRRAEDKTEQRPERGLKGGRRGGVLCQLHRNAWLTAGNKTQFPLPFVWALGDAPHSKKAPTRGQWPYRPAALITFLLKTDWKDTQHYLGFYDLSVTFNHHLVMIQIILLDEVWKKQNSPIHSTITLPVLLLRRWK